MNHPICELIYYMFYHPFLDDFNMALPIERPKVHIIIHSWMISIINIKLIRPFSQLNAFVYHFLDECFKSIHSRMISIININFMKKDPFHIHPQLNAFVCHFLDEFTAVLASTVG